MIHSAKPVVTIVHSLPGRCRVVLSHGFRDDTRTRASILEHPGLLTVDYNPWTRSVVCRYDPHLVSQEEIALRIALNLSLDHGFSAVRLLHDGTRPVLSAGVVYSGVALAAAALSRVLLRRGPPAPGVVEWISGLSTAGAVVDHAVRELRLRGYFDPEVLSLAYLITSLLHGSVLKASAMTWFMAFGRHLLEPQQAGVQVRPVRRPQGSPGGPGHEVFVSPDVDAPNQVRFLAALRGFVRIVTTGERAYRKDLLDELRMVSRIHGRVLEGFGRMRRGVLMRFD